MPDSMRHRLPIFAAALWWGSLSALALLVAPLLFAQLPTPQLAGGMAARLFSAQTWVSVGCGLVLLLCLRQKVPNAQGQSAPLAMIFVVGGMLLALLVEFAVAPRVILRENLRLWHSIASSMMLAQWVCAAAALWWAAAPVPDSSRQV